jgi:predicted ester cyclase
MPGLFSRRKGDSTSTSSQRIVERYLNEALIGGSPEALETTVGKDCQLRQIVPRFWNAFADRRVTINQIFPSADGQCVAVNVAMEARHVGPVANIEPTGKQVTLHGTFLYRLADGKIVEFWLTWDWRPLMH